MSVPVRTCSDTVLSKSMPGGDAETCTDSNCSRTGLRTSVTSFGPVPQLDRAIFDLEIAFALGAKRIVAWSREVELENAGWIGNSLQGGRRGLERDPGA